MKRLLALALLATVVAGGVGCKSHGHKGCGDGSCGPMTHFGGGVASGGGHHGHHGLHGRRGGGGENASAQGAGGAMGGQVAYPYYTNRGPRDYFAKDPGYPSN